MRSFGRTGCTFVMSTGIVSVDLAQAGRHDASLVLLGAAAVVWAALALSGDISRHLAGVPATGVLATRLMAFGWPASSAALAATAVVLAAWHHGALWKRPVRATGSDLLATVALQSVGIAVAPWLRVLSIALLVAGLARYVVTIVRFPAAEVTDGQGDQWIAGGAVAISSVAAARVGLDHIALALWVLALAWLVLLVAGEAARPRAGSADQRWSTVFPLGMYGAMTYAVGGRDDLAHILTGIAAAVWLIVLVANAGGGLGRPLPRRARVPRPPQAHT